MECERMRPERITEWYHAVLESQMKKGGIYIDATMGNGHDTLFLCEMAGDTGRVLAFDIQNQAIEHTQKRLQEHGVEDRAQLILESHTNMAKYLDRETADVICFNFGYLPGGDHSLATKADTSVEAVKEALSLLKNGGILCLCIYSGKDTGYEEKDAILAYLKELDDKQFIVIANQYFNRKNDPPMPVFVYKR